MTGVVHDLHDRPRDANGYLVPSRGVGRGRGGRGTRGRGGGHSGDGGLAGHLARSIFISEVGRLDRKSDEMAAQRKADLGVDK